MSNLAVEWVTVQEVADALNVNRMSIYRILERGEIPSIRVGHQYRVKREDVEFWLASGGTVPGAFVD